jgi:hypothetical protein
MMKAKSENRRDVPLPADATLKARGETAGEIDLGKVPPAVMKAVDRVLKGIKWTSAAVHNDDEKHEIYELFGEDAKGNGASAEVSADGKLVSAELGIALAEVPKKVMKSVEAERPEFKADTALATYAGDDIQDLAQADLTYQLNGTTSKGKDHNSRHSP